MESRAHAMAAGLFLLVMGIAAAATIWWLSDKSNLTRDYLLVATTSVTGLNDQAQVRYRGIRSGKVLSIDLDPQDRRRILVTIRIDAELPITRSTTARLNYQGVTGLAYVQLDDTGESSEPLTAAKGALPQIPLRAAVIDQLGDAALDMVQGMRGLLRRTDALLDDGNVARLTAILANIERLSADADAAVQAMPRLSKQLEALLSSENLQRLQTILANLDKASSQAAPLAQELRRLVAELQATAKRVEAAAGETGDEMTGNTLPRAEHLMQDLSANSRQLKRILNELEQSPQSILFGRERGQPGPGEPGFKAGRR